MAYLWSLKCRLFYLRIQECTNLHDYSQNKLEFTQKERTEDFKSWHFVQNHFVVPMWFRGKGKVLEPANGPYTRWRPTTSSSPALLAPLGALCWSSNTSGVPCHRALGPAIPCALNILSSNIPIVHCLSSLFFYFIGFHSITLFSAYFEIIIFKPLNLEFICYLVIDY